MIRYIEENWIQVSGFLLGVRCVLVLINCLLLLMHLVLKDLCQINGGANNGDDGDSMVHRRDC